MIDREEYLRQMQEIMELAETLDDEDFVCLYGVWAIGLLCFKKHKEGKTIMDNPWELFS